MLVESNRLHQKIKKLKEDLAREKELRREAEKQLKIFKESLTFRENQRDKSFALEITEPTNIAVFIRTEPRNNSKVQSLTGTTMKNGINNGVGAVMKNEENLTEHIEKSKNYKKLMDFLSYFSKTVSNKDAMRTALLYKEYKSKFLNKGCLTLDTLDKIADTNFISLLFKELSLRFKDESPMSWSIYRELLSTPELVNLPDIWIMDIMQEFVYKYQTQLFDSSHAENNDEWDKNSVINILTAFLRNFANEKEDNNSNFGCLAITQLIQIYISSENIENVAEMVSQFVSNKVGIKIADAEVMMKVNYEIGFSLLLLGKFSDAVQFFLDTIPLVKKVSEDGKNEMSFITQNTERCIGFCLSSNAKIKKTIPKNIVAGTESVYQKCMEEWKDGKVESFWKFFADCSPYISRRELSPNSGWKGQNFKHIKFCLQRVTTWKPLKNLKGLLKVMKVIPFSVVPKSILPVTTESDIKFFCDNNNGLNRLVNCKSSAIDRVMEDFPNIHRKETLALLIMQYHKILQKQRTEDRILGFGRKFMSILNAIRCSEKINVDDVICYIREVSKISMDEANQFVESQCAI